MSKIRIFSYLPNPRVWKSIITAKIGGIDIEVIGDKPNNMPNWLWDFDAKPISEEDKSELKSFEIKSKRGFKGSLYKLTIADISFACEFAQFLREGHYLQQLESKNLSLISKNFQTEYPLTFKHFKSLCNKKEFSDVMGSYLDWYEM